MISKNKIREGYDLIRPTREQKQRMLENIFTASAKPVGKDVLMKKYNKRRPMLIAAMVALSLLLVGCAAVAMMELSSFKIGSYTQEERAWINADGELIPATEVTREVISLQGIADSVNQKAAKEWYDFEKNYDTSTASDDFSAPRQYDAYPVFSQEMVEKVDEIAEKYGLELAGRGELVQDWQKELFYEALGIDSLLQENAGIKTGFSSGYFYENGNFRFGIECDVSDAGFQWEHPLWLDVKYKDKGYFDTVFFTMDADSVAEQWVYPCQDGTEVLVVIVKDARYGDTARIFCDREDAFLTGSVELQYFREDDTVDTMTREDLERMLDSIDFSIKPQKPNLEQIVPKLEAADKAYQAEMEARMAELGDPFRKDSYAEVAAEVGLTEFALADLDGDGVEECLFSGPDGWEQLYTMKEGKTEPINVQGDVYFCENGVVETYEEVGMSAYLIHGYYKVEEGKLVVLDRIIYDFANEEWARSNDGIRAEEVISREEAERILASYVRTELEMRPVSELEK